MVDGVACQFIPVCCTFAFLVVNILRKKSVLCESSLVLLFNLVSMVGSLFMYFNPRTGDPYTSCEAMLFFSACYAIFCIPALLYRDGALANVIECGILKLVDERRFVLLSRMVACLTFASFCYFLFEAVPYFTTFASGLVSREDFRSGVDMSHTFSLGSTVFGLFGMLSYVSLFLGLVAYMFFPENRALAFFLCLGGMTYAVNMLKYVARDRLFEPIVFACSVVLVLFGQATPAAKRQIMRVMGIALLCAAVPFAIVTVTRFGSSDDDRGVFYSLVSYFATGPYSFNVDYTAHVEYDVPPLGGIITCPVGVTVLDKLTGGSRFEEGQSKLDDMRDGITEYRWICGAYSGEFKTIVGSFLMDYPAPVVPVIFLAIAAVFSFVFCRMRQSLSYYLWGSIYFYSLAMGPIGYGFTTRYPSLILVVLVAFGVFLRFARVERVYLKGNEGVV